MGRFRRLPSRLPDLLSFDNPCGVPPPPCHTVCRRWVWIQFPWLVLHCAKAATEGAGVSGVASKKTSQPYWTRKRVGDDPVVLADPLPTKTLLQVRV
jgi:hypothetical protein